MIFIACLVFSSSAAPVIGQQPSYEDLSWSKEYNPTLKSLHVFFFEKMYIVELSLWFTVDVMRPTTAIVASQSQRKTRGGEITSSECMWFVRRVLTFLLLDNLQMALPKTHHILYETHRFSNEKMLIIFFTSNNDKKAQNNMRSISPDWWARRNADFTHYQIYNIRITTAFIHT